MFEGFEDVKGIEGIKIKPVKVTHLTANVWLDKNLGNRRVDTKRVGKYARDMQEGRWKASPQDLICFDTEGKLMNGQHRLNAVVKAKVPTIFFVATDCPPELQIVMDKGRPRRVADTLHMFHNVPRQYAAKVSSITRYILAFELGLWEAPNEADAHGVWEKYQEGFIWLFEEAADTPWNKGAYYAAPLLYTFANAPGIARTFHLGLATCRPQVAPTPMATLYKVMQSPRLRTGGHKGFQMALRVFNAIQAHSEGMAPRSLYVSTVGYDKLKREWGLVLKKFDGSCTWMNCPGTIVDSKNGHCWIHKTFGGKATTRKES